MTVRYIVSGGHPRPLYSCQRRTIARAEPPCQSLPGAAIDRAVSELVLETVTPASIDVAVEVFEELRSRAAEVDRAKRAQIARLREDAELAQRQFLLVRPENRLVADNLERHWNEALQRLAAAEEAYAGADKTQPPPVTPEMKERVAALVADLPRVWHDPRTPARDRKRMLRLLIEDVTLLRDDVIRVSIRWRGGATRRIECPLPLAAPDLRRTPAAVVEQVRALATEQIEDGAVERSGPVPVPVGEGLEATEASAGEAAFDAASLTVFELVGDEAFEEDGGAPALAGGLCDAVVEVVCGAEEPEASEVSRQGRRRRYVVGGHRRTPGHGSGRRGLVVRAGRAG